MWKNAVASVPPPQIEIVPPPPPRAQRLPSCRPLDDADQGVVRELIAQHGLSDAARITGVPKNTLAAAAGGARLREGTRMLLSARLRRHEAGEP